MNNVVELEVDFNSFAEVYSLLSKSMSRVGWQSSMEVGRGAAGINIDRELPVNAGGAEWSSSLQSERVRNFCSERGTEIAGSDYSGGKYSGIWFSPATSRVVRHVDWELCDSPELCDAPSGWGHDSSLVPYPYLFLQTASTAGLQCIPANRLFAGTGPGVWMAHLSVSAIPDWQFISSLGLVSNEIMAFAFMDGLIAFGVPTELGSSEFIALAIMGVSLNFGVYQSDFTGSDLANAGLYTEGGLNGYWTLDTVNNYATGVNTGGNPRAGLYTTDTWSNNNGFTLKVTWRNVASMTRFSLGLLTSSYATTGTLDPFNQSASGAYGIGFSAAGELAGRLLFNNGTTTTILSSAQGNETIIGFEQTLEITVSRNLWSYSLNGAAPTTGAFTFETGLSYRFAAWAQNIPNSQISSIQIS